MSAVTISPLLKEIRDLKHEMIDEATRGATVELPELVQAICLLAEAVLSVDDELARMGP